MNNKELVIKKEQRYLIKRDFKKNKSLYLLFLPVLLYILIFHYVPMYGLIIAFKDYSPALGVLGSNFVGLKHFISFFSAQSCKMILWNTVRISFCTLLFGFPAPILLALLMNELKGNTFKKIVQNFTYLPHFVSLVVVCSMIRMLTMDTGLIGMLPQLFGGKPISMLNEPKYFTSIYVISGIWQEIGWGSVVYLAALTSINSSLYEAAQIDGANRFKQIIHITIPGILPTVVIMLLLRMGNILNVGFEKIILLYNDATIDVADVISTYVYRRGLISLDWSYSAAVGLFNSVVNFGFIVTANLISKKVNETSLW